MVLESRRRIVINSECGNIYTNMYINTFTCTQTCTYTQICTHSHTCPITFQLKLQNTVNIYRKEKQFHGSVV